MIINKKKKILVTVGTTEFQALIKYFDSQRFIKLLQQVDGKSQKQLNSQQYVFEKFDVLLQIGAKAQYQPKNFNFIRLSDRISEIYHESDFIICHGGAGTLLENLRDDKKIIAVANNTLAGNHQLQLVKKLSHQGYLLGFENVQQLEKNEQKIKDFLTDKLKFQKYQKVTKSILNDIIFGDN